MECHLSTFATPLRPDRRSLRVSGIHISLVFSHGFSLSVHWKVQPNSDPQASLCYRYQHRLAWYPGRLQSTASAARDNLVCVCMIPIPRVTRSVERGPYQQPLSVSRLWHRSAANHLRQSTVLWRGKGGTMCKHVISDTQRDCVGG
jgi:hypothetical protein